MDSSETTGSPLKQRKLCLESPISSDLTVLQPKAEAPILRKDCTHHILSASEILTLGATPLASSSTEQQSKPSARELASSFQNQLGERLVCTDPAEVLRTKYIKNTTGNKLALYLGKDAPETSQEASTVDTFEKKQQLGCGCSSSNFCLAFADDCPIGEVPRQITCVSCNVKGECTHRFVRVEDTGGITADGNMQCLACGSAHFCPHEYTLATSHSGRQQMCMTAQVDGSIKNAPAVICKFCGDTKACAHEYKVESGCDGACICQTCSITMHGGFQANEVAGYKDDDAGGTLRRGDVKSLQQQGHQDLEDVKKKSKTSFRTPRAMHLAQCMSHKETEAAESEAYFKQLGVPQSETKRYNNIKCLMHEFMSNRNSRNIQHDAQVYETILNTATTYCAWFLKQCKLHIDTCPLTVENTCCKYTPNRDNNLMALQLLLVATQDVQNKTGSYKLQTLIMHIQSAIQDARSNHAAYQTIMATLDMAKYGVNIPACRTDYAFELEGSRGPFIEDSDRILQKSCDVNDEYAVLKLFDSILEPFKREEFTRCAKRRDVQAMTLSHVQNLKHDAKYIMHLLQPRLLVHGRSSIYCGHLHVFTRVQEVGVPAKRVDYMTSAAIQMKNYVLTPAFGTAIAFTQRSQQQANMSPYTFAQHVISWAYRDVGKAYGAYTKDLYKVQDRSNTFILYKSKLAFVLDFVATVRAFVDQIMTPM